MAAGSGGGWGGSISEGELAEVIHEALSEFTAEGAEREISAHQLLEQLQRNAPRYRTLTFEAINQVALLAFRWHLVCLTRPLRLVF